MDLRFRVKMETASKTMGITHIYHTVHLIETLVISQVN